MALTRKQQDIANLKAEIGNPATTPIVFKKRCLELLSCYPSGDNVRFVNKIIFARIDSGDEATRDHARKFKKELEDSRLEKYRARKRKLAKREIPPGFGPPVPVPQPPIPTPAPAAAPATIPDDVKRNAPTGAVRVKSNAERSVWVYLDSNGKEIGRYEAKNNG